MTATTDHYLGIDVLKRQVQIAIPDHEGQVVEEVRVTNPALDKIAQEYAGSSAAFEAGSNYFTIYDRVDETLDVSALVKTPMQNNSPKFGTTASEEYFWAKIPTHV